MAWFFPTWIADTIWGDQPGLTSEMQQLQAFQNRFAKKIASGKFSSAEALACELRIVPFNITLIAGVHQSPKNFHFRRDVNEHLCDVERSDKMTLTLSFCSGRNFRNVGLEAQATSNVPFKLAFQQQL